MPTSSPRPSRRQRKMLRELHRFSGKNVSIIPLLIQRFASLYPAKTVEKTREEARTNTLQARSRQNVELGRGKSDFVSRRSRPRDMSARPWNKGDKMSSKKKQK